MSATVVSRHFGCTRKTIERLRRRFRIYGNVADRPRSGRPRVTTAADDRYIYRPAAPTKQALESMVFIHRLSENRLRQNVQPIRTYRPYFVQIFTRRHQSRRHLHFRLDLILFFDECRFKLSHANGGEIVYHRRGERFAYACH